MRDFPHREIADLLSNSDKEVWRGKRSIRIIESARIEAYLKRRAHKKAIRSLKRSSPQKTSAISYNRKVNKLARRIIVAAKRSLTEHAEGPVNKATLMAKQRSSIILDGMIVNRSSRWKDVSKRVRSRQHRTIKISRFCFLTNPQATMDVLHQIAEAETECLTANIDFLDEHCADIGPWLLLAAMRKDMAPVFSGGKISGPVSKVIAALKLQGPLRFDLSIKAADHGDVWAFPVRTRRAAGSSSSESFQLDPQAAEKVGGELCTALNVWLDKCAGHELTTEGRRCVKKIVGECLDNAERHSRREHTNDGDWMITGFMAKSEDAAGNAHFRCQLAFLSVGCSISDSISDADEQIRDRMQNYVDTHQATLRGRFADQHLRTIYALQDTVTRDHEARREGRGGTGFRDILCLFGDLAGVDGRENDATLAIVSGRTCLHIAHHYCDVSRPLPNEHFNIWLNARNDRSLPPDQSAIVELDKEFRGTLITMGFTLDSDYLERRVND